LLAAVLPLPTDADDWITTQIRHLYGNPQGNIGGPLPGLPYVPTTGLELMVDEVVREFLPERRNAVPLSNDRLSE
jgi:hypothetical protein